MVLSRIETIPLCCESCKLTSMPFYDDKFSERVLTFELILIDE